MGIKKPKKETGSYKTNDKKDIPQQHKHPIFCFKYLDKKWGLENCDKAFRSSFIEKIIKYSSFSWYQLQIKDRHKGGCETLDPSTSKLKCKLPGEIYDGKSKIYSFRASGLNPFVGIKQDNILHVIGIDHNMKMYDHGS